MLDKYLSFVASNWLTAVFTLIVVMIILNYSTALLEEQLSLIGKKLKIPTSVRGATFDAMSSSLPELLTSLAWLIILKEKWLEVGIWTIWGSAIFNILIIPALVLMFYTGQKIKLSTRWVKRDSIFYILAILIFIVGLYFWQLLYMAWALIFLYMVYVIYLYLQSRQHRQDNFEKVNQDYNSVKDKKVNFLILLISLILIYVGVEASIVAANFIWEKLHISILIVSLVLLASLTSIPDTLLSIKSSKKWDIDAWLSNAVGSNIFDICIWLGLPLLIGILFLWLSPKVNFYDNVGVFIFLLISTIAYFFLMHKKTLSKKDSWILFGLYFLFVVYLIFIAYFK